LINFEIASKVQQDHPESHHKMALQTFVILPKEKITVWVKQNVNFFQQNGSVIKIEQN
jgi:hypothetical protein